LTNLFFLKQIFRLEYENYQKIRTKGQKLADAGVEYPIENLQKKDPTVFKAYTKDPVLKEEHRKNREMGFYEHSN
jgi:hypothetical protein